MSLTGKQVIIFYSDGEHVSRKDGQVTNDDDFFITLNNNIMIPHQRIVRVEVSR